MTRELAAPPERNYGLILRLQDDGNVIVEDENGIEASPRIVRLLRGQKGDEIRRWLEREVEKLNAEYDACVNLHMATPDPRRLRFPPMAPFDEIAPVAPTPMAVSWLGRLLGRRAKIEAQNEVALARYRDELTQWRACKEQYEGEATEWMRLLNAARSGEQSAMEMLLDVALADIAWPNETEASFDFGSDSSTLDIDVDLPDEDDMPRNLASVATRGLKVQIKQRSDTQARRDLARLAHATLFRIVGEAFAALPTLQNVTISGYVQRPDAGTGQTVDEYVLSVRVPRAQWEQMDFARLEAIDPAAALERFQLIRSMERTGRLRSIKPLQC